jgi:hypothetical protein
MSSWNQYVKENYHLVAHLPNKERFKALSEMRSGNRKPPKAMRRNLTLYDVLVQYMNENYSQAVSMSTTKNIKFEDKDGRQIFVQLKWNQGHRRLNGELIIKEITIEPKGGDVMTKAVARLVSHENAQMWGLNKVVLESVLDRPLFDKLQARGWVREDSSSNLYFYVPGYTKPSLMEIFLS